MIEAAGWLGAVLLLTGYALLATRSSINANMAGHIFNLFGSLGIVVNTAWYAAYAPMTLNIIWMIISVIGIFRTKKRSDIANNQMQGSH